MLGGIGYCEESELPRLYREMPVNSIWEGSGNIMCLDVLVNRSLGMPIRMIFPSIGFIDDGLPVSGATQAAHVRAKCYSVKIN